jgi:hypothetical protein
MLKSLALLMIAATMSFAADQALKMERGSLVYVVSSDDAAQPDLQRAGFILVACRTAKPETADFFIKLTYSIDGKTGSLEAKIPRLQNNLLLPPTFNPQLIAAEPWTPHRFFLPTGAVLKSVSVEERSAPAVIEVSPSR